MLHRFLQAGPSDQEHQRAHTTHLACKTLKDPSKVAGDLDEKKDKGVLIDVIGWTTAETGSPLA